MISTAIRERSGAIIWILAIGLALLLPELIPSKAALTKMCLIGIAIIFAFSYNVLLGQTGLLSFGHAVYFGVSGFAAIHIINLIGRQQLPIPVFLVPLMAGMVGAVFGLLFGALSTKRHGTAFAMISLAIAELVAASSLILETFFGGESGVTTDRSLGRLSSASIWFAGLLSNRRLGRNSAVGMCIHVLRSDVWLAVRDNPERATHRPQHAND
jgi:branched-chain amino acid transport system permease protein